MADKYRLTVNIAESLLPIYNNKEEPYKLCISKKVGNDFNVVFQIKRPLMTNVFSWTEDYQIYLTTDPFESGAPVIRSDAAMVIHSQQLFTLTEFGTRQLTDGKNIPAGQFNFRNNFDDISAVISCSTAGGVYKPIYQQPTPTPTHGTARFTPKNYYKVWLQQNIDESYMLADIDSTACEVEYTKGVTQQTITLNNAEIWVGDVKSSDSAPNDDSS
ncbi:hypothetical protein B0O99DRAFT_594903 [Bisporella sp. PMI_857]|nr:hypothetical protein B0O99DRAFT_594903 [Bisporella sp. PMI_857]